MSSSSFSEIKTVVENWWSNLQVERKCNSTNTIQKLVNNSHPEIQELIRGVISQEINNLIGKCYESEDLNDLQRTCNAINGCFDNFSHALDAVRLSLSNIISFISFGLAECQAKLNLKPNLKNTVLELLHSLSRVLILVLKLNRTQKVGKAKSNNDDRFEDLLYSQDFKQLLCGLTHKIGQFLMTDDILIDTKNNLSMAGILIREILLPDENKIKQFHENFIRSIHDVLKDEDYKINILKFLTCSAIINVWSVNIIDCNSTDIYLKFFISLCEKYSSETPIVLNTSRTLLLLVKHESFKNFVTNSDWEKVELTITMLLSCVFMLLEHPIACVRHSAKDFLQLLTTHSSIHSVIIDSVFKLPRDKRSYFISIGALANEIGSEILIQNNPELPAQLIAALCDPTIVSHVSLALEYLILNDSLAEKNFPEWCETYIVPLLISLVTVLPIVAADIEKLLEKAFKKYQNSVVYVIQKWAKPTSEELRYVITALKISQKHNLKIKNHLISENERSKKENNLEEKDLINEKLLVYCLHQRDDNIRISAFAFLIEAHKTTKPYSSNDFKLILYFLKYNLNNQEPSTRQKIMGLIRKMLVRFSESKTSFLKPSKNEAEQEEKTRNCLIYNQFLDSLVEFCFSNIFVGCNFNRLNTVLNILLVCFENIKNMSFHSEKTNFYWSKFLIALDSSYEENKELAVLLTNKLDFSLLDVNNPESTKLLYDKAFNLCTHMEPPDVLTGSYLLQILTKLPLSKEVLSTYFVTNYAFDDVYYYCILVLAQKLKEQIHLAKLDLMTAATCGPMYGALFAIRLTFKNVDFSDGSDRVRDESVLRQWKKILNELVELCFDMTQIVGCVVNSSSPEGHLPMDFQTDFENILSRKFNQQCDVKTSSIQFSESDKTVQLIRVICNNFFKKFKKLELLVENPDCDTYESLRGLNALLKENQLLISKIKTLLDSNHELSLVMLDMLEDTEIKIEGHLERLLKTNFVIEWPATAQVLLLCAWRSIKEASLYLGDLFTKLPIEKEVELGLLTKTTIVRVGEELKTLLCEIKHRGAFEHVYIGFTQLVNSLWKCSDKSLSNMPKQWLEDIINQLESPVSDQKVKLCSTRRSAGLPFLVQAIICSEIVSVKSVTPSSLHSTMKSLLGIIKSEVSQNPDSKIHALNVLRALFKHAQLGEHVASSISKALMVAICGSRAATWSERNSSSLLFTSLITRIFGVSRSRDEISKKNRMTSRYSDLYDFLLSEMELVYSKVNHVDGVYPRPSLYLVLLILGRLYPPPTEDPGNINLSEFLPYINMSRKNPVMKIRELGARALIPLISLDRLMDELEDRFMVLSLKNGICDNERHGILLQIKELLCQSPEAFENSINKTFEKRGIAWIEKTKWMLECPSETSLIVGSAYVRVLHIVFKIFPPSREKIAEVVNKIELEHLLMLTSAEQSLLPGIYVFLERFYFLKTDILACQWLDSSQGSEKFIELFTIMLDSRVSEVQSIPLRILCYDLKKNYNHAMDFDDDFSGVGVPLMDFLFFQYEEAVKNVQLEILKNAEILKKLIEPLNNQYKFKSTVIHRLWLSVVSTLVMNDTISISHSTFPEDSFLKIEFAKSLIKSGDKDLSTSSLICYAIYLMEEVFLEKSQIPSKDQHVLGDILNEFSSAEADMKERLTVAKILNRCCKNFPNEDVISDPNILKIWMIPLRLLADDDPEVRLISSELVYKMQELIIREIPQEKIIIDMKTLDWPHLPLVSLKSQECLLDSYINLLGSKNLLNLIVQMLIMAASSFSDLDDLKNHSKDEFGVFEKGNPNPYCEDLALSDLICQKLNELSALIDLKSVMWAELNSSLGRFISDNFHLSDFIPHSLMEVVEMLTTVVEDTEKLKGEFSLPRLQIKNLRRTLDLPEVV